MQSGWALRWDPTHAGFFILVHNAYSVMRDGRNRDSSYGREHHQSDDALMLANGAISDTLR